MAHDRRRGRKSGGGRGGTRQQGGAGKGFYIALAVVVVGGIAALLLAGRSGPDPLTRPPSVAEIGAEADPEAGVAMGPADAPVTILEFTDFQCPACKQFNALTGRLLRQNYAGPQGPVRWVAYDFPLQSHPNAVPAAIAARCAEEGGRFWEMHDLLLGRQQEWAGDETPGDRFVAYARDLNLEIDAFEECLAERRHLRRIMASARYGEQLGVGGTPTLFVNGSRVENWSYRAMEEQIRSAAAAARSGG